MLSWMISTSPGTSMFPQVPLDDPLEDWRNKPINYGFSEDYPVFWGPGQLTIYPDIYMNPTGWRDSALLRPPIVVRGFTGGKNVPPVPPVPPPPTNPLCATGIRFHYMGTRRLQYGGYFGSMWSGPQPCCRQSTAGGYAYFHAMTFASGSYNIGAGPQTPQQILSMVRQDAFAAPSDSPFENRYIGRTGMGISDYTCGETGQYSCQLTYPIWAVNAGVMLPVPTYIPSIPVDGNGDPQQGLDLYYTFSGFETTYHRYHHFFYNCQPTFGMGAICVKITATPGVPEGC